MAAAGGVDVPVPSDSEEEIMDGSEKAESEERLKDGCGRR